MSEPLKPAYDEAHNIDINLVGLPMLLILFILVTTFRQASEIFNNLPRPRHGNYRIRNKNRWIAIKGLVVIMSAGVQTLRQSLITLMGAARQLGLLTISIAAQQLKATAN